MQNKLGKHFITGVESTKLLEHEKKLLDQIRPLGLIFFARNFDCPEKNPSWRESFSELIREAVEASSGSIKILSIDYEGGRVHRFPACVKQFPYARSWRKESRRVALEMKEVLDSFSINMTYCPVLDVDLEAANPVIGERAFSSDPEEVISASIDFFQALDKEKIITCGKHFPGHGRTKLDSHFELPLVSESRHELETDLSPFKSLISEGIPCLMSAHVRYPALDPLYPASLSKTILEGLCRKDFGFSGIICTDDLDMKALHPYSLKEKTSLALNASSDILLVGNGMDGKSLETVDQMIKSILPDLSNLEPVLERSGERIKTLLENYLPGNQEKERDNSKVY